MIHVVELVSTAMKLSIRDWTRTVNIPRERPQQVFIRFGMWESNNRSYNHANGQPEQGLSVYPARWNNDHIELDESAIVAEHPDLPRRYAFPVTRRVVGYGSDGEPVLKGVRVLPYAISTKTKRSCAMMD